LLGAEIAMVVSSSLLLWRLNQFLMLSFLLTFGFAAAGCSLVGLVVVVVGAVLVGEPDVWSRGLERGVVEGSSASVASDEPIAR
jgi:hypothetical protein